MSGTADKEKVGTNVRGCANLAIASAAVIWALLFLGAANHYRQIATFGYPDATGAWDFWVYLPLGMAIGLLVCAFVFNFALRSGAALMVFAVGALLAVLPYLMMTSGGV